MQDTRRSILEYLRRNGSGTVEALADEVELAPVTVRHHLGVLCERGHLEVEREPVGRGRPRHVYRLSPKGGAALSDEERDARFARLAGRLLDTLKAEQSDAAEHFFRDMARQVVAEHRTTLEARDLEGRLDTVVELLSDEGFAVRWEREGDAYLIHEAGCPFQPLSRRHDEICCMDLELIRSATGAEVTREHWRCDGDADCTFRVQPAEDAEPAAAVR